MGFTPLAPGRRIEGLARVVEGCAIALDGVRAEARAARAGTEAVDRIDECVRMCREAAGHLRRALSDVR